MKAPIVDLANAAKGEASLKKEIFGIEVRPDIMQRVVLWQLAKRRAGTHSTKSRGEVSGSTIKMFKQKGTGRARQGSKRVTQMRGGGIPFGPNPRDYSFKLPKKVRALGLRSALSEKASGKQLLVLEPGKVKDVKTSAMAAFFAACEAKSLLIIADEQNLPVLQQMCGNLPRVQTLHADGANVYDILRHQKLCVTSEALKKLEQRLQ